MVSKNGGIGPGVPEIPANMMFYMKPYALSYGARYDRMTEAPSLRWAPGGKGFFFQDPKDLKGTLEELMNRPAPPSSTSCSRKALP